MLIECRRQSERVGAGIGNAEHFQQSRRPRFAVSPDPAALGKIEDEIGRRAEQQPARQRWAVAKEFDFVSVRLQGRRDRGNRFRRVEFFFGVVGQLRAIFRSVRLRFAWRNARYRSGQLSRRKLPKKCYELAPLPVEKFGGEPEVGSINPLERIGNATRPAKTFGVDRRRV